MRGQVGGLGFYPEQGGHPAGLWAEEGRVQLRSGVRDKESGFDLNLLKNRSEAEPRRGACGSL